jgi:hypothetical protein
VCSKTSTGVSSLSCGFDNDGLACLLDSLWCTRNRDRSSVQIRLDSPALFVPGTFQRPSAAMTARRT